MENVNRVEPSELPEIPTTVIYRKNISQCSKSFLIDTLLSKNETPAEETASSDCKRLRKIFCESFPSETKVLMIFRSGSASPSTSSISSSPPISPGHEHNFYQPHESQPLQPSFKYPMNYFTQLHQYPHFELFQHSRLFYPPIGEFNGLLCKYFARQGARLMQVNLLTGQHGFFGKTRRPRTAFTVESAFEL